MGEVLTPDEIRQIIQDEIVKKLKITIENTGYEDIGLRVKVEYDGWTLTYEQV